MTSPVDFFRDPALLAPFYQGKSWDRWFACVKAAYALPMTARDLALFREVAGNREPPRKPVSTFVALVGRGGGKDAVATGLAVYIATMSDFSRLRPGERASILCVAADVNQAAIAFSYLRGLFERVPLLAAQLKSITRDTIQLTNGAEIAIVANNITAPRGRTIAAAIFDEVCYWPGIEAAYPDVEVDAAVGPGLARWPGSLRLLISSVYRRSGLAYDRWRESFGKDDDDTLVVLGTTLQFNDTFDAKLIERDLARDPERYSAEYLSLWRDDLSAFVDRAVIEGLIEPGRHELPRIGSVQYFGFVDPSGGTSDAMTLAIAHAEVGRVVLDLVREVRPPFSPDAVVAEFAEALRRYGVSTVTGDRFGGEFPRELFRRLGIEYVISERPKVELYRELLPLLNAGKAELLDNPRLIAQICGLERRTSRTGKDTIGPPLGTHDDLANSIAGALALAASASVPAAWRREALLAEGGVGVEMPRRAQAVYATLAIGPRGEAAVLYWVLALPHVAARLVLADLGVAPLAPTLFDEILARLIELSDTCKAQITVFYCAEALVPHAEARGLPGQPADKLLSNDNAALALSAAAHISGGTVKVAGAVLEKSNTLPLGGLLDAGGDDHDPVRVATLWGIAIGLDDQQRVAA